MSLDGDALRVALTQPSPTHAIHALHEQTLLLQQRKILLSSLFYPLLPLVLSRVLDNRTRPCLVCCNSLAMELLQPVLPGVPPAAAAGRSSAAPPPQPQAAGSLFALLFRTASFPPMFVAPVRQMLPVPLQRMLRALPPQHLPAFFRARAVQNTPPTPGHQPAASSSPASVEFLELSMYEYYFLSCAAFLLQPDIHVQPPPSPAGVRALSTADVPPSPEVYNRAFLQLLSHYLDFFAPSRGVHSSRLGKLEEQGWNVPQLLQHGWSMVELMVEVLMGQFSYEAAQQPLLPASVPGAVGGAGMTPASPYAPAFGGDMGMGMGHGVGMGPMGPMPPPLDEFTLPSTKVINACMRIVYHLLEAGPLDSPSSSSEVAAATATRASILAYQAQKYAEHGESMLVKLRVDWHLFGMLQHCFTRWAPEWDTHLGMAPVLIVSAAAASTPASAQQQQQQNGLSGGSYSTSTSPARFEDRLTKLVELWLDYLEPWASIYNEKFNPLLWRWWIVANLPFYTVLLRDFLRLLARVDLGREQSPSRTAHLKTVVHLLKIFDGAVLEHVEDVEALLLRSSAPSAAPAPTTTTGLGAAGMHFQTGASRDAQQNQQTQQETFVVRSALLHLSGQRPETYVPVFAATAPAASAAAAASPSKGPSSAAAAAFSPFHSLPSTPMGRASHAGGFMHSPASAHATPALGKGGDKHPLRLLESQSLALALIRGYSIGYTNAAAISIERETKLLNTESESPAVLAQRAAQAASSPSRPGAVAPPPPPQGISLLLQEEQLGQHVEKRLREIFRLPEATGPEGGMGGRATPRAGQAASSSASSSSAAPGAPVPLSLVDLEPERDRSTLQLTSAGRRQVRQGSRLCFSRFDVPVLPEGAAGELPLICGSDEIPWVLTWATRTSKRLKSERGWEINLRPLANEGVFFTLLALVGFVIVMMAMMLRGAPSQ